ncbi:hypothetical protein EVAR_60512_1 [Eumeta japonica]|uniref:Reverse transcriptase domain-containing protein n=1 Tax=Eumeta variegata TaxID=151549 RepID=A0A4C1ZK13_EUMVA|nr:hypothetical protein EVAR_60512_1 [Eumeta japonica]
MTKKTYPMPNIKDEIARLTGQAYFISLDLTSNFYQVPISKKSKHLTSPPTPDDQGRYKMAPVPAMASAQNECPTTEAADCMMPWIRIFTLETVEYDLGTDEN